MTVTYSLEVSKARLGGFARLLIRWRGSIYKLIYKELAVFILLYYSIFVMYRYLLTPHMQKAFEAMQASCMGVQSLIPMTFVMGFYVSLIIGRWWQQYLNLPWPDRCAIVIAAYINGLDERGRMIRRTLVRYLNLMSVLALQNISTVIKRRFPTMDHLVQAGFMSEVELQSLLQPVMPHANYFLPACWFTHLAMQARKEGRIHDDIHLKTINDEMQNLRGNCGTLFSYDWISVPLVYTQVATVSVYVYFGISLIGSQQPVAGGRPTNATWEPAPVVNHNQHTPNYYFPFLTVLQFFFYMGWLKVAEQLINPLGEDDDDFEVNYLIDRNVQVGLMIVDDMYGKYPPLKQDAFWSIADPVIPYTKSTIDSKIEPYLGSAVDVNVEAPGDLDWALLFPTEVRDPELTVDEVSARSISVSSRGSGRGALRVPSRQSGLALKLTSSKISLPHYRRKSSGTSVVFHSSSNRPRFFTNSHSSGKFLPTSPPESVSRRGTRTTASSSTDAATEHSPRHELQFGSFSTGLNTSDSINYTSFPSVVSIASMGELMTGTSTAQSHALPVIVIASSMGASGGNGTNVVMSAGPAPISPRQYLGDQAEQSSSHGKPLASHDVAESTNVKISSTLPLPSIAEEDGGGSANPSRKSSVL